MAAIANVTPATLDGWTKRGCPRRGDGRFSPGDVIAWLRSSNDEDVARKLAKAGGDSERALGLWRGYRALREQLRLRVEQGQFVARAEVVEAMAKAALVVRHRLADACSKLPPRLLHLNDLFEIQLVLAEEVEAICDAFTRGLEPSVHGYEWPQPASDVADSDTAPAAAPEDEKDEEGEV